MTQDPYAAPQADIDSTPSAAGLAGGTGTFDIGQALRDGWRVTLENLGVLVGAGLVGLLVTLLMYATVIGIFLGAPVILYGLTRLLLNAHDGKAEFGDLFSGFSEYGAVLLRMLGFVAITTLLYGAASSIQYIGVFMNSDDIELLGGLIGLVFQLTVGVRLYWAVYFLVDQDMGPLEALGAAWKASRGNWLKLFVLMMMAIAIVIMGFLALVFGLIVAIPMSYLIFVSAYRQTVGAPGGGAARA